MADLTDDEKTVLAYTLLGEANGEGKKGLEAVMHVIMNRANSGRYPSNPAAVALQKAQFSAWNAVGNGGNQPTKKFSKNGTAFKEALAAVNRVLDGKSKDPTGGATHYYAPRGMKGGKEPYWWKSEAKAGSVKIGNHVFAAKKAVGMVPPTPAKRTVNDSQEFWKEAPAPNPANLTKQPRYKPVATKPAVQMRAPIYDPITGRAVPVNSAFAFQETQRRNEAQAVKSSLNAIQLASGTLNPKPAVTMRSPQTLVPGKGLVPKNAGTIVANKSQERLTPTTGRVVVSATSGAVVQALVPEYGWGDLRDPLLPKRFEAARNPKPEGGGFNPFGGLSDMITAGAAAVGDVVEQGKAKVAEAGAAVQEKGKVLTNPLVQMVLKNQAFLASHPDEVGTMKTVYGTASFFNKLDPTETASGGSLSGSLETDANEYFDTEEAWVAAGKPRLAQYKKADGSLRYGYS